MHEQESAKSDGAGRTTRAHQSGRALPHPVQGLLGLQRTTGNAAVVQMLRQTGHPWAQPEQHQHSADCGHRGKSPVVQRSAVQNVLSSGGSPLDGALRADMEARLGADFSDVRIHEGSQARASAAEVGAHAYTSGNHVVIGEGGGDKHTLAHELTHVIQQRKGPVAGTDNGQGLSVSDPGDRFEREAEANATRVMQGSTPGQEPTAAPTGSSGVPVGGAIQRRVSLRDAANPQETREVGDVEGVRSFFALHDISLLKLVERRFHGSLGAMSAGLVEFKAESVIREFVADENNRVYEDSATGAQELAEAISGRVLALLVAQQGQGQGAASRERRPAPFGVGASHGRMAPGQSGSGHSGPSHDSLREANDVLAQLARRKMAQHTPEAPFTSGVASGVQSAVTGRAAVFTEPLPSGQSITEGLLWTTWVAMEGEDGVRRAMEHATKYASPEEAQKLMDQFDTTLEAKKREAGGSLAGSVAAGQAISQAANFIPHPTVKMAAKMTSTVLGAVATAKKFGDGADVIQKIGEASPQTLARLKDARDKSNAQQAEAYLKRSQASAQDRLLDLTNNF